MWIPISSWSVLLHDHSSRGIIHHPLYCVQNIFYQHRLPYVTICICRNSLCWLLADIWSMHSFISFAAGTTWKTFWMARSPTQGTNQHVNAHSLCLSSGCLKYPSVELLWQVVECLVVPVSRSSASDLVSSQPWCWSGVQTCQGVPVPAWPDQQLLSGPKELCHDAAWLVVLGLAGSNHTLETVKRGRKVSSMDTHPWGRRGQTSAPVLLG